jgi:hypothetical protein
VTDAAKKLTLDAIGHDDDRGAACARHPAISAEGLMQLAMIGSRASAFHHDCASKLQGLVMALDELGELAEGGDPNMLRAIEAATESTRELHALLNINRALTKPPSRGPTGLHDLLTKAAQRVGITVHGVPPASAPVLVEVSSAAAIHALALVLDVAAGSGRGRSLQVAVTEHATTIDIALAAAQPPPASASEMLAIASYVLMRDGGQLWCNAAEPKIIVQLPAAP